MKILIRDPHCSQIELTNVCNLRCPMCPRINHMTRPLEYMDFELFKIILRDLSFINPRNGGIQIQLHHFGESTLHPDIDKFLKLCRYYHIGSMISSNGTTLGGEVAEKLIDNLDRMWISFDSIDKETYEKMRKGASFEKTIQNVEEFMKLKGNKRPEVTISTLIHTDKEKFRNFWKDKGEFLFLFKNYHNWRNEPDITEFTGIQKEITNNPCLYTVTSFCVLVNGDVVPCCMDYNGEMVMGNLKTQSIREIWYDSPKYKNLRIKHFTNQAKDINMCRNCAVYPQIYPQQNGEVKHAQA